MNHHRLSLVGDQIANSLSAFLSVLVLARGLSPDLFGAAMLGFGAVTFSQGIARAQFGIGLTLEANRAIDDLKTHSAKLLAGLVRLLPAFAAAVLLAGGLGGARSSAWLVIIVMMIYAPAAATLDVARYHLVVLGRAKAALEVDGVRLVLTCLLFVLAGKLSDLVTLSIWLLIGVIAATLAFKRLGVVPQWDAWRFGLSRNWTIRESVTVVATLSSLVPLLSGVLVARAYSNETLADWRAASTLLGPLNTLIVFIDFAVLANYMRLPRMNRASRLWAVTLGMSALALIWGALLLRLPGSVGQFLVGPMWNGATNYLWIMTLEYVALAATASLALELKRSRQANGLVATKVCSTVVILVITALICISQFEPTLLPVANLAGAAIGLIGTLFLAQRSLRERGKQDG